MVIIVEGKDLSGKSTLSKLVAKQLNYQYVHEGYTNDIYEKKERVQTLVKNIENQNCILYDRATAIDEFIYSFLNQDKKCCFENQKDYIKNYLKKCKIIFLTISEQLQKQRYEKRGDEFVDLSVMKHVENQYEEFFSNMENVVYIDVSSDDINQNLNKILNKIKETEKKYENKNYANNSK